MDDLISRAAAIKTILDLCPETTIQGSYDEYAVSCLCGASELLKQLPAVDAAPVVHGRWVKMTGMMPPEYHGHYECSECQWHMKGLRNSWTREEELSYCPNCGAKMDGEANG